MLFAVGGGSVTYVEQKLGLGDFFERGAEAGDEGVGQVADEADRVRQKNAAAAGQLDGAQFGIERGEHARGRENVCAGEGIEERAFAGVGVANESDRGHGNRFAALALLLAHAADGFKILFEMVNAALDAAAIGFELRFARSARTDAAAELRHGFAAAGKAGQHVFELRELNLQLAFARAGVASKDVEDELRAVEHAARQRGLEVAQLRGREIVIEKNEIGLRGSDDAGDLLYFAGTNERGRIGLGAALHKLGGDLAAGA